MSDDPILFFATDLDGTLLGDAAAERRFKATWESLTNGRPLLCFNTGRMQEDVDALIEQGRLPAPDYVISGVGTSVFDHRERRVLKAFTELLDEGWQIAEVESVVTGFPAGITRQPEHYQHAYKSSWFFPDAGADQINAIEQALEARGLDVHVIYSNALHLDVLPKWANKGNALRWLLRRLGIAEHQTLVAGDSGNDSAMFTLPGVRGIVVGNAQPELLAVTRAQIFFEAPAREVCAHAVLAGLQHYELLPPGTPEHRAPDQSALYAAINISPEETTGRLNDDQITLVRTGYHKAIEALRKNITPYGFTACSLADNEVSGTDVNYRSVWARDSALTLIGSLSLTRDWEDIHQCQRQTLVTLIENISPNGQVPANVRIDDQRPEYSGVGGIASIDSGLWVIIAFYAYVAQTHDYDFLRRYYPKLQQAMDWLGAHDSNNDALLEIPEAGDWTDLFGRSYNVLYDEVLWYRCTVCFGRLLQMLGDEQKAGDYLRWASTIKREILLNFWPSTQQPVTAGITFAERQFSIGDVRYLLAEITPFNFSWRCDTLGNILAFLYDVVDEKRAGQTFNFMWGAGVNEPFPITNLYPSVMGGDPDWRPYYAVNLLNLPHHYHNGGIWPFIGGHWVRYINKLGLRELSLHELVRLAELNQKGVAHEWEFNEWSHGRTGRPMGKAFQSWSASEYIRACRDLHVVT